MSGAIFSLCTAGRQWLARVRQPVGCAAAGRVPDKARSDFGGAEHSDSSTRAGRKDPEHQLCLPWLPGPSQEQAWHSREWQDSSAPQQLISPLCSVSIEQIPFALSLERSDLCYSCNFFFSLFCRVLLI